MYKNMMNNPLYQKAQMEAGAAEGRNNMAVSQMDRITGAQIAGEQKRLMNLDKAGLELATRKDSLAHSRKILDFQRERLSTRASQADRSRDLRVEASQNPHEGLEMGLGLLSLGATGYNDYLDKKLSREEMQATRQLALTTAGISYPKGAGADEAEEESFTDWYKAYEPVTYKERWSNNGS